MVVVHSAIMQDKLIKIVEACKDYEYKFIKKDGIKMYFEVNTEDDEAAAIAAKKTIKADPIGSTLLISVKTEK